MFWREDGGEGHFDVTIKTHSRPVERDERAESRSKIDPGGNAREERGGGGCIRSSSLQHTEDNDAVS